MSTGEPHLVSWGVSTGPTVTEDDEKEEGTDRGDTE